MREKIKQLILQASHAAYAGGHLPSNLFPEIEVEVPKISSHGDFSTNVAMVMASSQKMPPPKIAQAIVKNIVDRDGVLMKIEIAAPGFINFFVNAHSWQPVISRVHRENGGYGACDMGKGKAIQIEFVSSNPTGPLHVGHGRGAAVGDSLANIMRHCGYRVQREYYINDSGRQIHTLGRSVFLRYKALFGEKIPYPEDCYQGDYIIDYATELLNRKGETLLRQEEDTAISLCAQFAANRIIENIRLDLEAFGIDFDNWFSEQSLYDSGKVDAVIDDFRKKKMVYEKDGALWFKTTDFGDEKDRVVVRKNGQKTYFASDIAYHQDKFDRGFEQVIDVWGADHHGYIPRVAGAIEASGRRRDQFHVIMVHLVNLLRSGEPVAMSTRAGEFVTLRDVIDEVGRDAARFIFLARHYESPLDFDLELAKKKTNDNPVYYVQYVHARIASILRKAREKGFDTISWDENAGAMLVEPEEINLMKAMDRYPEILRSSAKFMEPHRLTFFLMDLASIFHAYYNRHRVLTDDPALSRGRLYLVKAVQTVIRNGLTLLGVSAPKKM